MPQRTLVTGGAGYIGSLLCGTLLRAGHQVRTLDSLTFDQQGVASALEGDGVELLRGDVRDPAARAHALEGVDGVVHLAAIVGDPACAAQPDLADEVNLQATAALVQDAQRAGVGRFVFASTCSNYGRMADPTVPITEDGELNPVSLYAEQKVANERRLLEGDFGDLVPTCLRFATVYGVSPRMRFDLTVNEFTRDLWADRELEVFGEQFWRPYVHAADAGRAALAVLEAERDLVDHEVFNVGREGENYTKQMLVEEIGRLTDRGSVSYVTKSEDPRDYKVGFAKIASVLGFETESTVPEGMAEVIAALDADRFPDPWGATYRNVA